ncbi:MAG: 7-carboxy-7-deazaguanine synthase QueE [Gammaproteobacteria bacterium]|nr:7-carboxy-7-deazaguanine synthase QueE [Pseudomonadota bacterium]MCH9662354.1 7-carboxy-7-deazaguanine synthase QueE [Gammaproteobacteria bacterium]
MTVNSQKPSPIQFDASGRLRVHSVFATLQGEGPWAGCFALFVRLHGCNLQCPRCDTDYTSAMRVVGADDLVSELVELESAPPLIVVTGGEPLAQNLCVFLRCCSDRLPQTRVQIETNGTTFDPRLEQCFGALAVPPQVVCSPKLDRVEPRLLPFISAFKYIVRDGELAQDGLPRQSLGHPVRQQLFRPEPQMYKRMQSQGQIFLQPEDSDDPEQNQRNLHACADAAVRQRLRLGIQTHKLVRLP